MTSPLVSVVIPTYMRPALVLRALRSALAQTIKDIEVIVIVDGRDDETRRALATIEDRRLAVQVPDRHLGNADARNVGIGSARAEYVAFLDDDDEWLPRKLEVQLAAARRSRWKYPIVTCRMIGRSESSDAIWPRRGPRPGEQLSEYFFCRRTPFTGEGMVINSAILTSRELMLRVPFRSGLVPFVDPDWLMRAALVPDTGLELVAEREPLLIWHIERDRPRISTIYDWRGSLAYARANFELFTARSYAAFVLHVVGSNAAAQNERGAFFLLLKEAFHRGRPAPVDVISHVGNFILPLAVQRGAAKAFAKMTDRRFQHKAACVNDGSHRY
ncbi:MAG TPA: glycosyltransferase family 2 protein [Candidatus Acidoferrales bacterium]|nr:glycosyltransferase family 2 protein [Candidatus Acidoferrales bacterium]